MNKANQYREVYAELRAVFGDELAAGEVLALAHLVMEAAGRRVLIDLTSPERAGFEDVDEMMRSRGWSLVEDARRAGFFDDEEALPGATRMQWDDIMRMAA